MHTHSRISLLLILPLLCTSTGCWCVPSVRLRNPHATDYEAACCCGRNDCPECADRKEALKAVPWPKFHPVPTHPVFEGSQPRMMAMPTGPAYMPQHPHGTSQSMPMHQDQQIPVPPPLRAPENTPDPAPAQPDWSEIAPSPEDDTI